MADRMTNAEIYALCQWIEEGASCGLLGADAPFAAAKLQQSLTAIRQLQQPWQGIESAPDNLDECALWCTDKTYIANGKYAPRGFVRGRFVDGFPYGEGLNGNWTFSHWMPLPHAPEPGQ